MRVYIVLVIIALSLFTQGCYTPHSLVLMSSAPGEFSNVDVKYAPQNRCTSFGRMSQGGQSGYGSFSDEIPESVTVSWLNENGKKIIITKNIDNSCRKLLESNRRELIIVITGPKDWSFGYYVEVEEGFSFMEIVDENPAIREKRFKYQKLLNAVWDRDIPKIQRLLDAGANVNCQFTTSPMTPLGASLSDRKTTKSLAITETLLKRGAKIQES